MFTRTASVNEIVATISVLCPLYLMRERQLQAELTAEDCQLQGTGLRLPRAQVPADLGPSPCAATWVTRLCSETGSCPHLFRVPRQLMGMRRPPARGMNLMRPQCR